MARTSTKQSVILSARDDCWGSPIHIVQDARELMGSIDCDPSTDEFYNSIIIKAPLFYTAQTNGLKNPWKGNVWLNPPYSIKFKFIHLANHRYITGQIKNCFMLLTLNTLACHASKCLDQYPVCIHRGRLNFVPLSGQDETQNTVNSAFVYLGEDVKKFELIFSKYGRIC